MITDKLLAFADGKALTSTANSDTLDLGKQGDEIARTLNLVAQIEEVGGSSPSAAGITAALQVSKDGGTNWTSVLSFPKLTNPKVGDRFINFAKLPIGGLGGKMRLALTISDGPLVGVKYSAWLTPSVEA